MIYRTTISYDTTTTMTTKTKRTVAHRKLAGLASSVLAMAAMACLAGCSVFPKPQADPTRFYVLTGPSIPAVAATMPAGTLRVGLQTVRTAPYLDGKSMIVRRGDNEIDYRDFARWAEPLSTGVGRMLGAQLLASGQVGRVYPYPFPLEVTRDVDVTLSVLRCEGVVKPDGTAAASFVCIVEVTDARADGSVRMRRLFNAPETAWKEGDYSALARQLSDAIAQLSVEVLAALPAR
ncbi:MAG: hypothetical protein RIQ79_2279 [Verrucomicrobiota bacterium]